MDAEAASHKDTAVQLYVNALKSPELHSFGLDLLDSALILFALDVSRWIIPILCQIILTFPRQRNQPSRTGMNN